MDEISRVQVLREHSVLDTGPEARFDRIAAMAAAHFKAPIALVSLVDTDRQWFKSCIGLAVRETSRDLAFCHHAIQLGPHKVMVVEDATCDTRFCNNALVTGDPFIRFYVGATLTTQDGVNLGTLCVIDTKPRSRPSDADLDHLCSLADLVVDQLVLSQALSTLESRHVILDMAEQLSLTGYWTLNTATGKVFWSPQVYAIHGVDAESFNPGLDDALDFYVEEDREMVRELLERRSQAGEGWSFDATIVRRDGSRRSVRSVAECQRDSAGRITGFTGVFKDLTDERHAIAQAVEQERRYRLLADHASDVISVYNADGTFSYLSPSVSELLGYLPEELVGENSFDIIVPEDRARVRAEFFAAGKSGRMQTVEYRAIAKDGTTRWLEARPRFHRDETGRIDEITDSVRDVTERRVREAALAEARHIAENAVNAKSVFLANMSHEIRTPLNGVLGFADVLSGTELDADQRRYVDRIRTAGKGLSALVDDILDFSKIESGMMSVEALAFDLRSLALDVVDLTRVSIAGRLEFDVAYDDSISDWIVGDEQRTRQVLLNLLGNAAKFTHLGSVCLTICRCSAGLELRIGDTGIGIAPEAMSRLFQGFAQADDSVSRRFGGTGLGLKISRSLAELMGGDLRLESELGVGTTAILTLPYYPVAQQKVEPPVRVEPGAACVPLKILAVDDVAVNLELIQVMVSDAGHSVTGAGSGEAALQILKDGHRFDLILMDVQMPGMDGLETTRRIRALAGVETPPIVALTANVMADQVEACRAAGMDDHIGKPINPSALTELFGRVSRRPWPSKVMPEFAGVTDPLAALKDEYRIQLQSVRGEYELMQTLDPQARADAIATCTHAIAGTAGSLGFPSVSDAAFILEAAAITCRDAQGSFDDLERSVQTFLAAIDEALA